MCLNVASILNFTNPQGEAADLLTGAARKYDPEACGIDPEKSPVPAKNKIKEIKG